MDLGLKGKVAIVTGAGGQIGFGRGIALALAKEGCNLIITYNKNADGAKKTVEEIKAFGSDVIAVKTDIRNYTEVKEMVKIAINKFKNIDILVNNAGGNATLTPFIETTPADWDQDINLNLKGTLNCTKEVLENMVPRKSGKIVNISSMHARTGGFHVCVYESAKAGVIAFTKGLALEVASLGINVNCVAPGVGLTGLTEKGGMEKIQSFVQMVPLKKQTTPIDVAAAVAYFASDISSDVTGQTLAVDGGLTMY
jgi:3-oxoacyl-[acyl-carrier protein] reductase